MARIETLLGFFVSAASSLGLLYPVVPGDDTHTQSLFRRLLVASDHSLVEQAYRALWSGRPEGRGEALRLFQSALYRDPASPYRWADLGEALMESGQSGPATYCLNEAVSLGPNSPSALMRAANLHFRLGEASQALTYTSQVLALTSDYDGVIFDTYRRMGVGTQDALDRALRGDRRAVQSFLHYWLQKGDAGQADKVWSRLAPEADARLADEYASFLFRKHAYEGAARVWARHWGGRAPGYLQSEFVFNGGFEQEPAGTVFDWRIARCEGVEVARDAAVASSGHSSLRIRFAGTDNLAYNHITQDTVVGRGSYRFMARLRTSEITTDEGIGLRIVDPDHPARLDVRTEPLTGTHDWVRVEKHLTVSKETKVLEIQVIRAPSLKFDNKISGTAWIDAVSLAPLDQRQRL